MLVSAIITTCKREPETVERAIRSIIEQTYEDIEIIVVDDSPEDYRLRALVKETVEALNSEKAEIKYIMHKKNMGACAARNTGVEESSGEIIGFLDDDDEWMPRKVEIMLDFFKDREVGLVYGNNILVNDDTGKEKAVIRPGYKGKIYDKLILENFIGSTSFPLIRRESLVSIGGFDIHMQSAQDVDVYLRISKKYKIEYINEIIARYHYDRGERITSNVEKRIAGLERLNEKNHEYLAGDNNAYWVRHMKLIPYYIKNREVSKAFYIWKDCVKKKPLKVRGNVSYFFRIISGSIKNLR